MTAIIVALVYALAVVFILRLLGLCTSGDRDE